MNDVDQATKEVALAIIGVVGSAATGYLTILATKRNHSSSIKDDPTVLPRTDSVKPVDSASNPPPADASGAKKID